MNMPSARVLQDAVGRLIPAVEARTRRCTATLPDERNLWREMSCCILSSQVPYELAVAAAYRLDESGILNVRQASARHCVERDIFRLLGEPLRLDSGFRRYRFPRTKAAQLSCSWVRVRTEYGTLGRLLEDRQDVKDARTWLVRHLKGMGPKQASMFLRNIGISSDVAVIDRHVIRYMVATRLWNFPPANLSKLPVYERHEQELQHYARCLGYNLDALDRTIWIVMRAASALGRS